MIKRLINNAIENLDEAKESVSGKHLNKLESKLKKALIEVYESYMRISSINLKKEKK
ncbi:MAG: hypothetical protein R3213_06795 [Flavobacteriaceae bacterium]|nr:hypothetical protein [Flavobacteriaceae bacterium]